MKIRCIQSVQMVGETEEEQYQAFTEGKEYQARKGTVKGLDGDPNSMLAVLRTRNDKGESHIIKRLHNDTLDSFFNSHFEIISDASKSQSQFDHMNFEGGADIEFVAHARKYSKEQAIQHCLLENDWRFEGEQSLLRVPTIEDVIERRVKYFIRVPDYCGYDTDGGCYTYCSEKAVGSFPVWVIEFQKLRTAK